METNLDYRRDFLCVQVRSDTLDGSFIRKWYLVGEASDVVAMSLVGRPVTAADCGEGIFVDEEGNVFQLAQKGETKPLEVEHVAAQLQRDLIPRSEASLYGGGIEVVRSFRRGAVDYATVPQLRGVDLEPYRKSPVEVVKINLGGQP